MSNKNLFEYYAALGYEPLPIIPHDARISERSSLYKRVGTRQDARGKTPGRKNESGTWGSYDWIKYSPDEIDLKRWNDMGAGIGLKTTNNLLAIDADTTDQQLAKVIKDIIAEHIGKPPVRVGRFPKALYVVRSSEPIPYQRVEFGPAAETGSGRQWRVEMLTEGRQFVAHGIHPRTQKPYEWVRPLPKFEDLPEVTLATIAKILEEIRTAMPDSGKLEREGGTSVVDQKALRGDPDAVRKAVESIPNSNAHFPSRESYRDVGYAIKAALPDDEAEAYEIFLDWCLRWEDGDNDPDVVASDWGRMKPPFRRGAQWLYELAGELSNGKFTGAEPWFEDLDEKEPNPFEVLEAKQAAEKQDHKRFEFLKFADVAYAPAIPSNEPLIKGLLDCGTMSVLYGDSNVGKTFIAMDMAFHIATGMAYGGMKTAPGLVVYVAAEGGNGAKKRMVALKEAFPEQARNADFLLLPSSVDLRRPDGDVGVLTKSLLEIRRPVSLLVIDTLSRALAGGDENSPVDMGALVKNLDALRAAVAPVHLMVVHHTGKDRAKGARGHTLLRAATDTELEVSEGVVTATKQRDLDKAWSSAFTLRVHVLGMDADGDAITSCTVRLDGGAAGRRREPTEGEKAVLSGMAVLLETSDRPEKGVRTAELKALLADNMSSDAVNAHLRSLRKKEWIEQQKRGVWEIVDIYEDVESVGESVENVFG